jgi:hypothetical protein
VKHLLIIEVEDTETLRVLVDETQRLGLVYQLKLISDGGDELGEED